MAKKPITIPEYIASKSPEARDHLEVMYACLQKVAPKAEQCIKWNMPTFTANEHLFFFAAFKKHISLFPTEMVIEAFKKELAGYTCTKAAIHFPLDKPIPKTLVTKIARYRMKVYKEK